MWGSHVSSYFGVKNGVKQGGVLSPIIFTIYIDRLLIQLKKSGYGCHINGSYIGTIVT